MKTHGAETGNTTEVAALTKFVVEKFDLSAWLNYMASARITQEMDDAWANLSAYYDNPTLREGVRGTGTWMPLAYDFNLSFGQWYYNDVEDDAPRSGLMATNDWFKSHPFYGGNRVRCHEQAEMSSTIGHGNSAFESIWQSPKFRRLYLRRLRTLMDQELKAPGTPEKDVPFMVKMRELAELMRADSELDDEKWRNDTTDDRIDVWGATRPANIDAGIDDIWNNYVVLRREHLYVTHSVTNTAKEMGYGSTFNAGIPDAQSALSSLKAGLSATYDDALKAVVIRNTNTETIDLSGWKLSGPVVMALPAGTVLDQANGEVPGEVYVTADRRATVAAFANDLADQVIVGNGEAASADATITLIATDGTDVLAEEPSAPTTSDGEPVGEIVTDAATGAMTAVVDVAKAGSGTTILIPEGVTTIVLSVTVGEMTLILTDYYTPESLTPVNGVLVPVLNPDVVTPSFDVSRVDETKNPMEVLTDAVNLCVTAKPGLWYTLLASSTIDFAEPLTIASEQATDSTISFTGVDKPGAATGFFKIEVSDRKNPNAP